MAAKKTADLIPLCHPLPIDQVRVSFEPEARDLSVGVICEVVTHAKTGVEMEALVAAGVAALTIYDMCKALEKGMEITDLYLLEKTGGKSGEYRRARSSASVKARSKPAKKRR